MICKTCGQDVPDINCCEVCYPLDTNVYYMDNQKEKTLRLKEEEYAALSKKYKKLYSALASTAFIVWNARDHVFAAAKVMPNLRRQHVVSEFENPNSSIRVAYDEIYRAVELFKDKKIQEMLNLL